MEPVAWQYQDIYGWGKAYLEMTQFLLLWCYSISATLVTEYCPCWHLEFADCFMFWPCHLLTMALHDVHLEMLYFLFLNCKLCMSLEHVPLCCVIAGLRMV